ncbi:hypothetical protein NFI96_018311, partial [Prochilodus magdalenae]
SSAIMADGSEFDLDYITERIIAISFHQACTEQTYLHNLRNIMRMLHSKHADNYLVVNLSEPREELKRMNTRVLDFGWSEQHAPSLHLLCSMCKSIENWFSTHSDNVLLLHCRGSKDRVGVVISSYINLPSVSTSEEQALDFYTMKRFYSDKMASLMTPYVQMFGRLLSRQLKINSSPLLFHCITLHHIPKLHPTECQLFVRVYQGMQTVCTTGVHQITVDQTDRVYFALEPPQLLKGDIMIVCYHKIAAKGTREVVFRMQFHTGTLQGHPSLFHKKDLDVANNDPRFPENGEVEVVFSESMLRIPGFPQGSDGWRNNSAVVIDYDILDPLVHWDSYENIAAEAQPSERAPSVSSDSGLSSNSQWTGGPAAGLQSGQSPEERTQLQRAIAVGDMENELPYLGVMTTELTEKRATGDKLHHLDTACHVNGKTTIAERETDILDDENGPPSNDTAAIESDSKKAGKELPALSSLAESVDAGDGICAASNEMYSHGVNATRIPTHTSVPSGFQTRMWVRQQQLVSAEPYMYPSSDRLEQKVEMGLESKQSNSLIHNTSDTLENASEAEKDDEFASLALDIDQSIEQLNQLILDLDPEFEPVPTRARGHMIHSASLHTNGLGHSPTQVKSSQSGIGGRQISDVTNESTFRSPAGDLIQVQHKPAFSKPSQYGSLYGGDAVDYTEFTPRTNKSLWVDLNLPPSTPAFPVSPPTPYAKSVYDFSHLGHSPQSSAQHHLSRTQQESRGYVDSMTHTPMSSEGDLFHPEMASSPASCQRMYGSMRSVNTPSPLPVTESPTAGHSWLQSGSNTPLSHYTPQPSPPLSLSAPNAHSSPRGGHRGLPSSLGVGGLELSLLEAMEGLESLGLDGIQPPLLPQKRRGVDGGELSLNSSLSQSAVSPPFSSNNGSPTGSTPSPDPLSGKPDNAKFVQDTSKFWYKPDISREQAIAVLKDREPGSFIVRDSHSFRGAYGLAMKVATPPPSVLQQSKKAGDLTTELVRHFLIECTQKGVRLKGCPNEPYFGSLTALVCQHSITPLALPCKLIIPGRDPLEELNETQGQTSTNSATELLKQGAACNVWFLGSVELESLTGVQAIQKAATVILGQSPPATSTIVHFKVSAQGITLTDNQRKLFFRRHYAVNTVIFCALDPQVRKWMKDGCLAAKIFGFVARKSGSTTENVCHLFAEHDPEQPASAIVNFVSKVMIGSQKAK